jgi:DNA (cytosine-5)-methyltransferase 1
MPKCEQTTAHSLGKYYSALECVARAAAPIGTDFEAVIDQWIHALAYGFECYGERTIASREVIRKSMASAGLKFGRPALAQLLRRNAPQRRLEPHAFTFVDLFAGIGGMRLGFQSAGGRCVFSSEWDSAAQQTYRRNHGELPFGDITKIPAHNIPAHDVLLAGFPCQPFSHAGKKLGINDTRGTLFYEIARILESRQPSFALLENVRGLISHRGGDTLRIILESLTNIGYECNIPTDCIVRGERSVLRDHAKRMVLRSNDFGVPQQRMRIYVVLWRKGLLEHFRYPEPSGEATTVGAILEKQPDPKFRLSNRMWTSHQRRKRDNQVKGHGFGYGLVTPRSPYTNTISARYYKDGSEVLVQDRLGINPRKLTPREAARLQGFPDEFQVHPSTVQCYRQFGNSVSVPVIAALAKQVARQLGSP